MLQAPARGVPMVPRLQASLTRAARSPRGRPGPTAHQFGADGGSNEIPVILALCLPIGNSLTTAPRCSDCSKSSCSPPGRRRRYCCPGRLSSRLELWGMHLLLSHWIPVGGRATRSTAEIVWRLTSSMFPRTYRKGGTRNFHWSGHGMALYPRLRIKMDGGRHGNRNQEMARKRVRHGMGSASPGRLPDASCDFGNHHRDCSPGELGLALDCGLVRVDTRGLLGPALPQEMPAFGMC